MTHDALARLSVIVAIRLDDLHRNIAGGGSFDGSDKHTGSVAGPNAKVKQKNKLNTTKAFHYTTRINSGFQALSANMTVEVRNKRIVGDLKALDRLFVDVFIESFDQAPKEIWLDLDATDDLLHGSQEQRFYHGYYKSYGYLALYIFCGEHLLDVQLHPSNQDASAGTEAELTRIVGHIRQHWPATKIVIRADSGFCRDAILTWCENNRVDYVVGVARNDRLVQAIDHELQQARRACHKSGEAARVFKDFTYRTRET